MKDLAKKKNDLNIYELKLHIKGVLGFWGFGVLGRDQQSFL